MSLRARSTSMTCSARSFGSASNSFSSAASSSGIFAARTRAGDRADFHLAFLAAHMNFRRRADERKSVQLQQKHVGRRIDGARRAINVQRRRLDRRGKPLRTDDLDDVAGGDVFLGRFRTLAKNFSFGSDWIQTATAGTSFGTRDGDDVRSAVRAAKRAVQFRSSHFRRRRRDFPRRREWR